MVRYYLVIPGLFSYTHPSDCGKVNLNSPNTEYIFVIFLTPSISSFSLRHIADSDSILRYVGGIVFDLLSETSELSDMFYELM